MITRIEVLIVEDSRSARMLLEEILGSDPQINVIGTVESGEAAIEFLKSRKPDVITMDIVMPGIDGFTATQRIMETTPIPIVIVSSAYKTNEAANSFKAMEAGAVAITEKPVAPTNPDYPRISQELIRTVKWMSEVKVVTRFSRDKRLKTPTPIFIPAPEPVKSLFKNIDLIAIGTSTGGPPVLQTILSHLPHNIPVPIVIVQHISPGFLEGLVQWLHSTTGFPVHIPKEKEYCLPGHVYLAPDDYQMGIQFGCRVSLEKSMLINGQRPSVSYLFQSVAQYFPGSAIAVLLTGMGNDGASELKLIRDTGSMTIAQDEASCVVYGMPGEAVKINGAVRVLPPIDIANEIISLLNPAGNHL